MGQKIKYKPEFCEQLIAAFDVEPWDDVEIPHYSQTGKLLWTDKKRVLNKIPTLTKFGKSIGIATRTLRTWVQKDHAQFHQDFYYAYQEARARRCDFLCDGAWAAMGNGHIFKFLAHNLTDMRSEDVVDSDSLTTLAAIFGQLALDKRNDVSADRKRRPKDG